MLLLVLVLVLPNYWFVESVACVRCSERGGILRLGVCRDELVVHHGCQTHISSGWFLLGAALPTEAHAMTIERLLFLPLYY